MTHDEIKNPRDIQTNTVITFPKGCAYRRRIFDWIGSEGHPWQTLELASYSPVAEKLVYVSLPISLQFLNRHLPYQIHLDARKLIHATMGRTIKTIAAMSSRHVLRFQRATSNRWKLGESNRHWIPSSRSHGRLIPLPDHYSTLCGRIGARSNYRF